MKEGEHASRTLLFSDVFWLSLSADAKLELARAQSPDLFARRGWVMVLTLLSYAILTYSDCHGFVKSNCLWFLCFHHARA